MVTERAWKMSETSLTMALHSSVLLDAAGSAFGEVSSRRCDNRKSAFGNGG